MKIAFVGLGQMGRPMALNMLKAAPGLMVHAADHAAYPQLQAAGAVPTDDRGVIAQADIVFLSLPSDAVVRDFLFADEGIAARMRPGGTVVDTSTIGYTATLDIAGRLADMGLRFLDAPVSGMAARAADGTLTTMCGGEQQVFDTVRPYLDSVSTNILFMGSTGTGQLGKLINQLLFDINCAALAEILPMAVKLGLDPDQVAAVVNSGTGRSYASEFFVPRILRNEFSEGYAMHHAYKDLISGAELSARMGVPLPVLAAATATYQTALLQGHGKDDKGAMVKVFETLLGVQFRSSNEALAALAV